MSVSGSKNTSSRRPTIIACCAAFLKHTLRGRRGVLEQAEAELGDKGITLGVLGWAYLRRTPLLQVQIDFAGPNDWPSTWLTRCPS